MPTQVASLYADLSLRDHYTRELGRANTAFSQFSERLDTIGRRTRNLGLGMIGLGTVSGLAMWGMVRSAMEFETAFAGVEKTVDAMPAELDVLRAKIREMATDKENPLSSLENAHVTLARIMELGGQLGIATENLIPFTESIGALTVATELTAEEAALMIAQFQNVSKFNPQDFSKIGDVIVALGNNSATTEDKILRMANRMALSGQRAGMEAPEILAFAAALASAGIEAELGGTNFSKFVDAVALGVAGGGEKLEELGRVAGTTGEEFKTAFQEDAAGALQSFLEGFGDMDITEQTDALQMLGLNGAEAGRVVGALAENTEMLGDAQQIASAAFSEGGAAMEEAAKKAGTTQGALNRLDNQVTDTKNTVGESLLPVVEDVADELSVVVANVGAWAAEHPKLVLAVAGGLTAFVGLGVALAGIGLAAQGAAVLLGGVGAAVGLLASPVFLGIGLGVALKRAWDTNFLGIQERVQSAIFEVKVVFADLRDAWNNFTTVTLPELAAKFGEYFNKIKNFAASVVDGIGNIISEVLRLTGLTDDVTIRAATVETAGGNVATHDVGMGGSTGTGITAGAGGGSPVLAFDNPFSRGRADGGPVNAGTSYIVGERGPEMFVPNTSGTIIPNGAGQVVIQNLTVLASDWATLYDGIRREAKLRA